MLLVSTGFKTAILGSQSFASLFHLGAIQLFSGTRPTTPDAAPTGTHIATISNGGLPWYPSSTGYGLNFIQNGPYIVGDATQHWAIYIEEAPSVATWWRLVAPGDSGIATITDVRLDGDIGLVSAPAGEELLLESTTMESGTAVPVQSFLYTIPPIPGV